MHKTLHKLAIAGIVVLGLASALSATPLRPNDENNPRLREQHELRDLETGYPHHVQMQHESDKPKPGKTRQTPKKAPADANQRPASHR